MRYSIPNANLKHSRRLYFDLLTTIGGGGQTVLWSAFLLDLNQSKSKDLHEKQHSFDMHASCCDVWLTVIQTSRPAMLDKGIDNLFVSVEMKAWRGRVVKTIDITVTVPFYVQVLKWSFVLLTHKCWLFGWLDRLLLLTLTAVSSTSYLLSTSHDSFTHSVLR
jgi:hypothetical protein